MGMASTRVLKRGQRANRYAAPNSFFHPFVSMPRYLPIRLRRRPTVPVLVAATFVLVGACSDKTSTTEVESAVLSISPVVATDSQVTAVGTTLPIALAVLVVDQNNQPVASASVTWAILTGAGSLGTTSSVTDATGAASTTWTLGTISGEQRVTATLSSGKADTLVAFATPGAVHALAITSDPFVQVVAGAPSGPLQVRAFDQYGNGVSGAAVTWSSSAGTLNSAMSTTGANGVADNTLTTSTVPQDHTVRATIGAFTSTIVVRGQ